MSAPLSDAGRRVLLIHPCLNEAKAISAVLEDASQLDLGYSYDSLVVDDGSTDQTFQVASRYCRCVRLVENLGIGSAVQTGIKFAYRSGYDYCVQIDGDGQHPPDQVAVLLEKVRSSPANVSIGSRYVKGDSFRSTWARRLGSAVISKSIALLFGGTVISDPTSGMRLMDRTAMAFFKDNYPGDYPEPISIALALREGFTVQEVAVRMRPREHGRSSILGIKAFAYMVRVVCYIFMARLTAPSGARGSGGD